MYLNLFSACDVIGTSEKNCRIFSVRSLFIICALKLWMKFCTSIPDLLISSCWNEWPDCLHTFFTLEIQSRHCDLSVGSPKNIGITSNAGSKSHFSCALIISWNKVVFWTIPCSAVLLLNNSCCCITFAMLWMDSRISALDTEFVITGGSCCSCAGIGEAAYCGTRGGGRFVLTFGQSINAESLVLFVVAVGWTITGSLDAG